MKELIGGKCECGSNVLFARYQTRGTWQETFELKENGDKEIISSSTDELTHKEPKTIRCADCGKRYSNPRYPAK